MASAQRQVTATKTIRAGGISIDFEVAAEAGRDACFCLGVRKSGSTMLHRIVSFLAKRNEVNTIDIPGSFFRNGLVAADWLTSDVSTIVEPGNVYVGFRSFPQNLANHSAFQNGLKIFMFRDPRDALVSQYFSDAFSHKLPETLTKGGEIFAKKRAAALSIDLDDFVLRQAGGFNKTLLNFQALLKDPTCLVLRYEDYVFQKKRLIHKIMLHFGWECHPGQVERLLEAVDEVPVNEDKTRFVRRVIPGDHRAKLSPGTIKRLNMVLAETLSIYDYF